MTNRLSIEEIAERLDIGKDAVYALLHAGEIPSIRVGSRGGRGRFIVTRFAFEQWERTCGMKKETTRVA